MKRIFTTLAAVLLAVGVATTAGAAKKTFIAIGTGGPTGVYFATGNAICRLVHKTAAEGRKKGRKHGIRCSAPSTGGSTYNIGQIRDGGPLRTLALPFFHGVDAVVYLNAHLLGTLAGAVNGQGSEVSDLQPPLPTRQLASKHEHLSAVDRSPTGDHTVGVRTPVEPRGLGAVPGE